MISCSSAYGRVAVTDNDISNSDLNTINENSKFVKKDILENRNDVTDNVLAVLKLVAGSKKTCHASLDVDNNLEGSDNEPCEDNVRVDNGTALILTPLIEQGRTAEAKNASRVDAKLFFGIESYSGFLTVDKTYKSHLYFWYFPSFAKPVSETPWIIWLQGGPGASSLTGLFDEIGPFRANSDGTLRCECIIIQSLISSLQTYFFNVGRIFKILYFQSTLTHGLRTTPWCSSTTLWVLDTALRSIKMAMLRIWLL